MVESRYVGLKSRGVYESPAHAILLAAHEDLESLVHDHRVLHDKAKRALDVAEAVYQGRWFTQEMESWLAANAVEQQRVTRLERGAPVQGPHPAGGALTARTRYTARSSSRSTRRRSSTTRKKARGFIDIQAVEQQAQMRQKRTLD